MGTVVKPYTFTNGPGNIIDAVQVNADLDTLYAVVNGNLQAVNLKAGDGLFDSYKTIASVAGRLQTGEGVGSADSYWSIQGALVSEGVNAGANGIAGLLYWDDADFAVVGKTLKLRQRSQLLVSGGAPGVNYQVGLFPVTGVTGSGGSPQLNVTLGAVVPGSTSLFTAPGANSLNQASSGDFTPPADGYYLLGLTPGAVTPANLVIAFSQQLQVRAV